MFSATLDGAVGKLAGAVQRQPGSPRGRASRARHDAAQHAFWTVDRADRPELTADIVRELGSTMVFCRTPPRRRPAGQAARPSSASPRRRSTVGAASRSATGRSRRSSPGSRRRARRHRRRRPRRARRRRRRPSCTSTRRPIGTTYVHRSGRTARAGASGVVVSLVERGCARSRRARICNARSASTSRRHASRSRSLRGADRRRAAAPVARAAAPVAEVRSPGRVDRPGRSSSSTTAVATGSSTAAPAPTCSSTTPTRRRLTTGQRVEFAVREGQKGLEAYDVVAV